MANNQSDPARKDAYDFENSEDPIRTTKRAQEAAKKFLKRLKTDLVFDNFGPEDKVPILQFMIDSVLNIDWYDKKIKLENKKYWIFLFISFGLLLLLPIVLFYFSTVNLGIKNQSFNVAGFIVAVLSSIIAFHKAFTVWFKTRLRRGEFWRAMSKIKEILYQIEGKYRGIATIGDKLAIEFKEAVLEATAECRKAASEEQHKFFDQQTLPDFELGKTLATAKTEAMSLISYNAPSAVKPNKS
jgi:hypothetical protein